MIKDIWINLPVKNVEKSVTFFKQLDFKFNSQYGNSPQSASLLMGDKNVVVMLFDETLFKTFTNHPITDSKQSTEILLSVGAESREEVDAIAKKAEAAGGVVFGKPGESQGWLYGCGFTDLDGHRWNVLFMDFEKMPK
jgi:predicted lactoylglutathione lyase